MNGGVMIAECDDYSPDNVNQFMVGLNASGNLDWVRPGMKIGIKLNLCAASAPENAAVTHPAMAMALARILVERGAQVVLGDSPGGPFNAHFINRLYEITQLRNCLDNEEHASGRISLNTNYASHEAELPQGVSIRRCQYCDWLSECDEIINFCKLKSHGLMGITGAVKNLYGVIPGTFKSEYHFLHTDPMDFANMLVDLNEFVKPRLCLVDAVDIMEGNGPTKGTPRHMGLMLAGPDPYMLDRIGARLLGVNESEIPYLIAAVQRGLLPENDSLSDGIKEPGYDTDLVERYRITDFKRSGATASWFARTPEDRGLRKLTKQGLYVLMRSKPAVGRDCTGCGYCAKNCPAGAIMIQNGKASIHRAKCVRCFCCQEFCPSGAMKVKRSPVARLLGR